MGKSGCGQKEPSAVVACEGAGVAVGVWVSEFQRRWATFSTSAEDGRARGARELGYGHLQSSTTNQTSLKKPLETPVCGTVNGVDLAPLCYIPEVVSASFGGANPETSADRPEPTLNPDPHNRLVKTILFKSGDSTLAIFTEIYHPTFHSYFLSRRTG